MAAEITGAPIKPGMPIIQDLSEYTESKNFLIYGDPGCGKTRCAGTSPNALFISFDPGTVTAARTKSKAQVARPQTWKEFAELLKWLRHDGSGTYEWLIIDSATEMQSLQMTGILVDPADGKKRDIDTPQIQDYGKWQHSFKRLIRTLNDMPENILYTAHAMRDEDENGHRIVLPDINGKNGTNDATTMSRWFCGTVHLYGYLKVVAVAGEGDTKETIMRLVTRRQGEVFGKDRYGIFTPYVDRPNIAEMSAKIDLPVK